MKSATLIWTPQTGWSPSREPLADAQFVLFFGGSNLFEKSIPIDELRLAYPDAHLVGCSTGGQIIDDDVSDEIATATVMRFERTGIATIGASISAREQSKAVGRDIGDALRKPGLRAIFVLSDGMNVNGSRLVAGLRAALGDDVVITGGLAGDGARFQHTLVHVNGISGGNQVAAVGFYGDAVRIGHGNGGGWAAFGPSRRVSRSEGNCLFELDDKPALDLYKFYLGKEADGLPGTGLLYPLLIADPKNPSHTMVRTLLAIDEGAASLTFAGDIPEGWSARLMRGHFDRLSEAAGAAAQAAMPVVAPAHSDTAAILVSCIGRRILMGENIVEEIAAARDVLGPDVSCAGFYAYGEISPHAALGFSELHNQTMTITTFSEAF